MQDKSTKKTFVWDFALQITPINKKCHKNVIALPPKDTKKHEHKIKQLQGGERKQSNLTTVT